MRQTVFYSWQSDLPNPTNRGLIQRALEQAAKMLAATGEVDVEPAIERDTQNVPGSPDIALTIFQKILSAGVFVADVSLVTPPRACRPAPNPNVLIELGFALHALGPERVILVFNRAFGPIERLPFDLRMRRMIPYKATDGPEAESERGIERKRLAAVLRDALGPALAIQRAASSAEPAPASPAEAASESVRTQRPDRVLLVRRSIQQDVDSLIGAAPPLNGEIGQTVDFLKTLDASIQSVLAFGELAAVVAAVGDVPAAKEFLVGLQPILEHYGFPRSSSGTFDKRHFDYFKSIGHELVVLVVAALIRESRWKRSEICLTRGSPFRTLGMVGAPQSWSTSPMRRSLWSFLITRPMSVGSSPCTQPTSTPGILRVLWPKSSNSIGSWKRTTFCFSEAS